MRLLVDQNLSPHVANALVEAGHDAVHTAELGLARATDTQIMEVAAQTDRVVLSADTDFGTALAISGDQRPSVILVRLSTPRRAGPLVDLLLANLDETGAALSHGAIVVLEDERVRIRPLPLR